VPALMAVQSDIARMMAAMRRGASRGLRLPVLVAVAVIAGVFALTLGPVLVWGAMPGWLVDRVPGFDGATAGLALGLFVGAAAGVVFLTYVAARLVPARQG